MAGNGKAVDDGAQPSVSKSFVLIEFEFIGSANFSMHLENVNPAQLLGLASWLEWSARRTFEKQAQAVEQANHKPQLVVPQMRL